jgi:hypothetical protein
MYPNLHSIMLRERARVTRNNNFKHNEIILKVTDIKRYCNAEFVLSKFGSL